MVVVLCVLIMLPPLLGRRLDDNYRVCYGCQSFVFVSSFIARVITITIPESLQLILNRSIPFNFDVLIVMNDSFILMCYLQKILKVSYVSIWI